MTKQELSRAVKIAQSDAILSSDGASLFSGCALYGFKPITITINMLASFIRWHIICFDGSIDTIALNEIASYGKLTFKVI